MSCFSLALEEPQGSTAVNLSDRSGIQPFVEPDERGQSTTPTSAMHMLFGAGGASSGASGPPHAQLDDVENSNAAADPEVRSYTAAAASKPVSHGATSRKAKSRVQPLSKPRSVVDSERVPLPDVLAPSMDLVTVDALKDMGFEGKDIAEAIKRCVLLFISERRKITTPSALD